jgi:predicted enzyme related to lactoylglutathione lyase
MNGLMYMVDHTIVHFEIPAKDAKKLMKFYADLFGWKMEKVQWMDYWLVETVPVNKQGQPIRQGVNGGLCQKEKENADMTQMNYINVESVDEYIEKIRALGGKIIVPKQEIPDTGWTAIAVDPDGNYFGLFQRK